MGKHIMGKAVKIDDSKIKRIRRYPRYFVSEDRKVYSFCNSGYREVKQKYVPNGVSLMVELYTSRGKKSKVSVNSVFYDEYPNEMKKDLILLGANEHPTNKGYHVTKDGRVYSTFGNNIKEMNPTIMNSGYYAVNIDQVPVFVHRLVIETYVENIDGKQTVNHIDGDKLNNSLDNLEWSTYSENNTHAIRTGLRKYRKRK